MKKKCKSNHHQKRVPLTLLEIISLLKPKMEVVSSNRRIIDGLKFEFVKFVAHFPRLSGECDRILITSKMVEGTQLTDLTSDVLTLDKKSQLFALAKEVHHA